MGGINQGKVNQIGRLVVRSYVDLIFVLCFQVLALIWNG